MIFFIECLLFGFFRGIIEGMVMIQDTDEMWKSPIFLGIHSHKWFKYYPRLAVLSYLFLALICWYLSYHLFTIQIAGLMGFAIWEAFEIGYAYARGGGILYENGLSYYENVFGIILQGWWVIAIHCFRIWWITFFWKLPRLMEIWGLN